MVRSRAFKGVLLLLGFGGLLLVLVFEGREIFGGRGVSFFGVRGLSFSGVFAFAVAVGLPVRL
jgi:hypothetical protein